LLGRQRIACRVRTHAYFDRHAGEFTIRSSRPSGAKTELEKIIQDKWCHYFLYAFSDSDDATLHAWTLANLEVFREWFLSFQGHVPGELRENHDGSSCFRAFRWASVFAKHPRTGAPFIIQSTLPPQLLPTEKFQAKPMRQPTLFGGLAS
jgi:hypothetical protein